MIKKTNIPASVTAEDIVGAPKKIEKEKTVVEEKKTETAKPEIKVPERSEIPEARPLPARPSFQAPRPVPVFGFNGVVDERVIPDAGVPTETVNGVLDTSINGYGYLRPQFMPSPNDIYISASQIRRFQLRVGDMVTGQARRPKENERYWGLLKVERVNDVEVDSFKERPDYESLGVIFPDKQVILETEKEILTTRLIDLVSPIGKGQRALVVSPPKAGKTWLIKDIAAGVAKNYPKVHLMAVLIGERPEEVTDIRRHIEKQTGGKGEVIASNFDQPADEQTRAAEIALERAKRLVELGNDVFIILDSITRLARAYNLAMPTSGRTLSGGFDPAALFPAKHFFGAARNIENGGSLTIVGTCLVETGSRMDDLIYEEFKGTGNMELHLVRNLAEKRVFPAMDIQRSGTRQEELLYGKGIYEKVVTMRRMIDVLNPDERTEVIIERLKKTKNNNEFLDGLTKG